MSKEENLHPYFEEFIKSGPSIPGIKKIKPAYLSVWNTGQQARKNSDYICDLFFYEPKNVEEAQLGSLFMLGEIKNVPKNKHKNFDFLLNLLISVIKRDFYSNSKRSSLEALESSLSEANLYLIDFTKKGNVEWIGNFNFICGVFSKNILHITSVGETTIKLCRETRISHIEKRFPTQKKTHPSKTFGNIASGRIFDKDKLILGTKNILTIAPLIKLRELFKKDRHQIIENFKRLAKNKNNNAPIVCMAIEIKTETAEKIIRAESTSASTLVQLSREKRLNKKRSKIINKWYNFKTNYYYQNKLVFWIASFLIILILILPFLIVQKINYYIKISNFKQLSIEIQEVQKKTDIALIYQDKIKAKGLIQKNQILINQLLVFTDKSSLENDQKVLSETALLLKRYQEQQDSLSNIKRISSLKEIFDFSNSNFIVNPVGMAQVENNLYFYELESGILYKLPIEDNIAEDKRSLVPIFISTKDELRKMVALESGQIIFLGQSGKAYIYNSNNNGHNTYSLNPKITIESIQALKGFSSNFYLLDNKKNDIIKYSFQSLTEENDTIEGTNWLAGLLEKPEEVQSMAIDGSIYILNSDGTIIRYFRGERVECIRPALGKILAGENKIFTKDNFVNLYISDPKNKRLIILDKKEKIISQYLNDEFANIQDFLITKDEKEVYLLCRKKIFRLEL